MGEILSAARKIDSEWGDIPDWAASTTDALLQALKVVDSHTYEHCLRVGNYSKKLAQSMGLNEFEQKIAEYSGALHDIGKMGIAPGIVHKPGKLTPHEYQVMKDHPVLSAEILKPFATDPFFQLVIPAVRFHHERYDGLGYPACLPGDQIPLVSRIILIVDTLDAMTQNRAYRSGLPIEMVYEELKRFSGTQFDPHITKIFLESHRFWGQTPARPLKVAS